jgi:hypothetical protein
MEFKKGQAVSFVTRRDGVEKTGTGKFVLEHVGPKGSFIEIDPGDGKKTIKVRPANVSAA